MASDKPKASSEGAQNEEVDLAKVTSIQLLRELDQRLTIPRPSRSLLEAKGRLRRWRLS